MHQLVHRINHEGSEGAVQEDNREHQLNVYVSLFL
jgi:hypothetical protein